MFLGFLIGVIVTWFVLYLFGRRNLNQTIIKGYKAYSKHVTNGHLVVSEWQTVEDVFFVLLVLINEKRQHDNFAKFLGRPVDPKDAGHDE